MNVIKFEAKIYVNEDTTIHSIDSEWNADGLLYLWELAETKKHADTHVAIASLFEAMARHTREKALETAQEEQDTK